MPELDMDIINSVAFGLFADLWPIIAIFVGAYIGIWIVSKLLTALIGGGEFSHKQWLTSIKEEAWDDVEESVHDARERSMR